MYYNNNNHRTKSTHSNKNKDRINSQNMQLQADVKKATKH